MLHARKELLGKHCMSEKEQNKDHKAMDEYHQDMITLTDL